MSFTQFYQSNPILHVCFVCLTYRMIKMVDHINFKSCRLCQKRTGSYNFLCDEDFISKVYTYTNIKLGEHCVLLPRYVCTKCKHAISVICDFITEVSEANKHLLLILEKGVIVESNRQDIIQTTNEYVEEYIANHSNNLNNNITNSTLAVSKSFFKCEICDCIFNINDEFSIHLRTHPELYCTFCNREFPSIMKCNDHKRVCSFKEKPVVNTIEKATNCSYGKNMSNKEEYVSKHKIKLEIDQKNILGNTKTESNVKKIKLDSETLEEPTNILKCGICDSTFEKSEEFNIHIKVHPELCCRLCHRAFRKPNTRTNHERVCLKKKKTKSVVDNTNEYIGSVHDLEQVEELTLSQQTYSETFTLINHETEKYVDNILELKETTFKCNICPNTFNEKQKFNIHLKTHLELCCTFCNRAFTSSMICKNHKRICSLKNNFKKVVDSDINEFIQEKQHESNETEEFMGFQIFKCSVCLKDFTERQTFENHKRTHPELCCSFCNRSFSSTCSCEDHIKICSEKNSKQSLIMDADAENVDEVIQVEHCERDIEVSNGKIICYSLEDLNFRQRFIKIIDSGQYQCQICEKIFNERKDCRNHKMEHPIIYACNKVNCNKTFKTIVARQYHAMRHLNHKPNLCIICGKSYTSLQSLKYHEKTHLKSKEFKCKMCKAEFTVSNRLKNHCAKVHGESYLQCSQCPKQFLSRDALLRHEIVHTGIREFECSSCSKSFFTNKELKVHSKYHLDIRAHKCHICFKTFFESYHLRYHLRIHSGEKPYVCDRKGCGKKFITNTKLKSHMKIHLKTVT